MVGAVLLVLLLVACTAAPGSAPATAATQKSEAGQVTVTVTWAGAASPAFDVALDTHAGDLDGYDLTKLAILRADDGREVRPTEWTAGPGGHHRAGRLVFPAAAADGQPLIGDGARTLELVIRDLAGVPERSFRWTL